ncbi:glycosyl hydrolase [Micromonospora sp. WMMD714]|uniref:glycoside hydrolase family 26 protein n=1 Tax=Micromonospora sp. WMMD714 TaxID=3016097 RepID=UPI00249A676C|nr:glycosyl hydrolase [Micromonospora sp. WMMD714]WFE62169.1 glycosyl hydrolase [Micromonospora sp. WMMD714]
MTSRQLFTVMTIFVIGVFGYAALAPGPVSRPARLATAPSVAAPPTGPPPAYDVRPLTRPAGRYLGVALNGAPQDMSRVDRFADLVGRKPNIVTIYESFDDEFAAAEVRKVHRYGALPIVRWEPFTVKLKDIAAGRHDPYLVEFAVAVRRLNLPVALTVAHEMNGHWYSWGAHDNRARDFVAAWRHIHAVFAQADATNVIWAWTPNVVNPVPSVKLAPLYPGDAYVDWVGIDGYFTRRGEQTFDGLFGPTITQVRRFTDRPLLIVETGSEPGAMRRRAVDELFTAIRKRSDLLGFVYFNQKGSGDWVIDSDRPALAAYRAGAAADPRTGFRVG